MAERIVLSEATREEAVRRAGEALKAVSVPMELQRDWRVEEDFVASVRAAGAGTAARVGINPSFEEGLAYMRKVEAVHVAARERREVELAAL